MLCEMTTTVRFSFIASRLFLICSVATHQGSRSVRREKSRRIFQKQARDRDALLLTAG
jgi:hypothetical protein